MAAYTVSERQIRENLAAMMYHALGIPRKATWRDVDGRPHEIYLADPTPGLM